jgi:serine/threonine-protein kinase
VVPVYELGELPDRRPFFTMKLVKGRTLGELLEERSSPAEQRPRLLKVFEHVCQALAYAHKHGVIHRDLKPANVMVGAFGEVQVMDWGLARALPQRDDAVETLVWQPRAAPPPTEVAAEPGGREGTRAGSVLGTPAYMPPEQARGEVDRLDARADVFGLGAILCHILTGQPPFAGGAQTALKRAAAADLAQAFAYLDGCGADAELIALAQRCLAPAPADRPRDAGALAAEVTAYLESVEARLRRAELEGAAAQARAQEERKRRRVQLALAASLLVLLLGGGGGWLWVTQQEAARELEQARSTQQRERGIARELQDARVLRERAKRAPAGERRGLAADARAAAQRADGLAADPATDAALRGQVAQLLRELGEDERDRRMVEQLSRIRDLQSRVVDNTYNSSHSDEEYARAFREYGLDVERLAPDEAASRIKGRPVAAELVAGLDDWVQVRRLVTRRGKSADWAPLIAVARAADPDPWRDRFRAALLEPRPAPEVLRELAASVDVAAQSPQILHHFSLALMAVGHEERLAFTRRAQQQHPGDFWLTDSLAAALSDFARPPRPQEALPYLTACVALRPDNPGAHYNLGQTLVELQRDAEALPEYEAALRLDKNYSEAHDARGALLARQGKYAEALKSHRRAFAIKQTAMSLINMGWVLTRQGEHAEAERVYRQAVALEPDNPFPCNELAIFLHNQRRPAEAIDVYRQALDRFDRLADRKTPAAVKYLGYKQGPRLAQRMQVARAGLAGLLHEQGQSDEGLAVLARGLELDPTNADLHFIRGNILKALKKTKAAVAAYEEALRFRPAFPDAYTRLAAVYYENKQYPEAAVTIQKALRLLPRDPHLLCMMAETLEGLGQFGQAVTAWQQGLSNLPDGHAERPAVTRRLQQAQAWAALDRQIFQILTGKVQPARAEEWLPCIKFAEAKTYYLTAARLWKRALALHPELTANVNSNARYVAAAAAVRAGLVPGRDTGGLDEEDRARWRMQALAWLGQDLERFAQLVDGGTAKDLALVRAACQQWQQHPALTGVRDAAALGRLPEGERQAWQQFWAKVAALSQAARDA